MELVRKKINSICNVFFGVAHLIKCIRGNLLIYPMIYKKTGINKFLKKI